MQVNNCGRRTEENVGQQEKNVEDSTQLLKTMNIQKSWKHSCQNILVKYTSNGFCRWCTFNWNEELRLFEGWQASSSSSQVAASLQAMPLHGHHISEALGADDNSQCISYGAPGSTSICTPIFDRHWWNIFAYSGKIWKQWGKCNWILVDYLL